MPRSKCNHKGSYGFFSVIPLQEPVSGDWACKCFQCEKMGPFADTAAQSIDEFWKQEKEMVEGTYQGYKAGYRQGVIDATDDVFCCVTDPAGACAIGYSALLQERRKKLLYKKVTKWVAIFEGEEVELLPDLKLYDSKKQADSAFEKCANYRGAFPIEIETQL